MITENEHYYYKGAEYVVIGFTKLHDSSLDVFLEAVIYKAADFIDDPDVDTFVRDIDNFSFSFIPAVLGVDMYISVVEDGKVVDEYKVTSVENDSAVAINADGHEIEVLTNVSPTGAVTVISEVTEIAQEFLVTMPEMEKRIYNGTLITEMLDLISNALTRVANINPGEETYAIQSAQNSLEQTFANIYSKFGV